MKSNHLNIYHLISKARDGLDANDDPFTNHQLRHYDTTYRDGDCCNRDYTFCGSVAVAFILHFAYAPREPRAPSHY